MKIDTRTKKLCECYCRTVASANSFTRMATVLSSLASYLLLSSHATLPGGTMITCLPAGSTAPATVQLVNVINANPLDTLKVQVCLAPDVTSGKCSTGSANPWLQCSSADQPSLADFAFVDRNSNATIYVPDIPVWTAKLQYLQWSITMGTPPGPLAVGPLDGKAYEPLSPSEKSKFVDINVDGKQVFCCGPPLKCQTQPPGYWTCPAHSTCDATNPCSTGTPCLCKAVPTLSPTPSPTFSPTTPSPTTPTPTTLSPTPSPTPSPTLPPSAPIPPPTPAANQGGGGGGSNGIAKNPAELALVLLAGVVILALCGGGVITLLCWGQVRIDSIFIILLYN